MDMLTEPDVIVAELVALAEVFRATAIDLAATAAADELAGRDVIALAAVGAAAVWNNAHGQVANLVRRIRGDLLAQADLAATVAEVPAPDHPVRLPAPATAPANGEPSPLALAVALVVDIAVDTIGRRRST